MELEEALKEHMLKVEKVLGGMDLFLQRLEQRMATVEEQLGTAFHQEPGEGLINDVAELKEAITAILRHLGESR